MTDTARPPSAGRPVCVCGSLYHLTEIGGAVWCAGCGRALNSTAAVRAADGALARVQFDFRLWKEHGKPEEPGGAR